MFRANAILDCSTCTQMRSGSDILNRVRPSSRSFTWVLPLGRFRTALLACLALAGAAWKAGTASSAASETSDTLSRSEVPDSLERLQLAFFRDGVLYTVRADGSQMRRVAEVEGAYNAPHWSPDGTQFLVRVESTNESGEVVAGLIVSVPIDGGPIVNLSAVSGSAADGNPNWSPNGEQIVFDGRRGDDRYQNIYVMNADGSQPVRLTDDTREGQYPAWSPDGTMIAYTVVDPQSFDFDVWVMDSDGANARNVSNSPADDNWATWSPDSDQLAFFSTRQPNDDSDGRVWVVNIDGSDPHPVSAGGMGEPDWSPDGNWIAVNCGLNPSRVCAVSSHGSRSVLLPIDNAAFPNWRR